MILSKKVELLRKGKGLSRKRLGILVGKSGTHIRFIELRDRPNPQIASVCMIAKVLGVSMDELLKDTEFDPKNIK